MRYNIKKNWLATFEMLHKHPDLMLPFILIAFFEILALQLIYFANRFPISVAASPVIKKFFGEAYLHYPACLTTVPPLFYYAQVFIYIFAGTFLAAITVNMFRNYQARLPVKAAVMARNASKRYGALVAYGALLMLFIALIKPVDAFFFSKGLRLLQKLIPRLPPQIGGIGYASLLFVTNYFIQAVFVASIPFMILHKKGLIKAIFASVVFFVRNILTVLGLIALPFLVYLPIVAMKGITMRLIDATCPEVVLFVACTGSVISVFVDSFIVISICQLIADTTKVQGEPA